MEHSILIDRPPADVFRYLTDVETLPEWQESAVAVRAAGPVGMGARFEETRSLLGRRAQSTVEVIEYEPGRRFSLRVASGPLPFEVRHTLTPANGGTRLDWVAEADTSRFPRLAVRFFAGTAERQFKADLARFKDILEGRAEPLRRSPV